MKLNVPSMKLNVPSMKLNIKADQLWMQPKSPLYSIWSGHKIPLVRIHFSLLYWLLNWTRWVSRTCLSDFHVAEVTPVMNNNTQRKEGRFYVGQVLQCCRVHTMFHWGWIQGHYIKDHLYFMKNWLSTLTCYQYYSITQTKHKHFHAHTQSLHSLTTVIFFYHCQNLHNVMSLFQDFHVHTHTHTQVHAHARMHTHTHTHTHTHAQETGWRESRLPMTTLWMTGANCTPQKTQSLLL